MIFSEQIRLYGKHARMLRKYSKDKGDSDQFLLEDGTPIYFFDNMFKCFMVASMIGISFNIKAPEDKTDDDYATMFVDIINNNRKNIERICQHLILSKNEIAVDERIKKAFTITRTKEEEKAIEDEIIAFARGGLEKIDELFKGKETYDSIANVFYSLPSFLNLGE